MKSRVLTIPMRMMAPVNVLQFTDIQFMTVRIVLQKKKDFLVDAMGVKPVVYAGIRYAPTTYRDYVRTLG